MNNEKWQKITVHQSFVLFVNFLTISYLNHAIKILIKLIYEKLLIQQQLLLNLIYNHQIIEPNTPQTHNILLTLIPMQQCNNCQQLIDQTKFDLHHNYCIRNIKKCAICFNFYDKNQEEDHLQYDCKSNIKLKCQSCQKQFDNKNQLLNHLNSKECNQEINKNRKQSCRFCQYCLLDVPMQSYDEHLSYCQSRTKICDHCGQGVMNKKFAEHIVNCEEQLLNKALIMSQDQGQNQQTRLYKPSQSDIIPNVNVSSNTNNQFSTYTYTNYPNYVNQTSVLTNNSNSNNNSNNNYNAYTYTTTYTTSDANNNNPQNPQIIKKQISSYSNPVTVTRYVYKPEDSNRVIYHQAKVVGVRQTIIRNPQPLVSNKKIETVSQESKNGQYNSQSQKNGSNNSQSQKSSIQSSVSIPSSSPSPSYTYSNNNRTLSINDRNLPSTTIADSRTTAFTTNSAAFQNSYSQSGYYPSYNPSQTRSEHYNMPRTNPISSTTSNQNILYNQSFDEYQFGHENSQEQMMQAALMASMGMLDQNSMSQDSKIYRQIQDQKEIQKSIKK